MEFEKDRIIELDDITYSIIKTRFRTKKEKPKTLPEFQELHVSIIRHLCGSDIIEAVRDRSTNDNCKKRKYPYTYQLYVEIILKHLRLYQSKQEL